MNRGCVWWWYECGVSVLIISSSRLHILKHFIYSYVECHRVQKHQNNNTSNTWILHTVWNDEPTIHWILCVPQIPSFSHLCAFALLSLSVCLPLLAICKIENTIQCVRFLQSKSQNFCHKCMRKIRIINTVKKVGLSL